MKLLLDTHAFIWWDSAPAQLSAPELEEKRKRQQNRAGRVGQMPKFP
jgi:PIN domain nuclease of toxin-antitoxin system